MSTTASSALTGWRPNLIPVSAFLSTLVPGCAGLLAVGGVESRRVPAATRRAPAHPESSLRRRAWS